MIGDVGRKIGPAAVGFLQRPGDIVAEPGRAEQGLRARFPIIGNLALGRLEHADIDQIVFFQPGDHVVDCTGRHQFPFGGKQRVMDAERRQVLANQVHHFIYREIPQRRKPLGLVQITPFVAVAFGQLCGRRNQVIAGI